MKEIARYAPANMIVMLCGLKMDLDPQRSTEKEEAEVRKKETTEEEEEEEDDKDKGKQIVNIESGVCCKIQNEIR